MKTCFTCKLQKPSIEFGLDRHKPDGLNSSCKHCKNLSHKKSREKYSQMQYVAESKTCPDCSELLPSSEFQASSGSRTGLQAYCRKCGTARRRASRYKISKQEYIRITSSNCEACGSTENIVVDHDHNCCDRDGSCGSCVRGALCKPCNLAEGILKTQANVEGLLKYMKLKGIK